VFEEEADAFVSLLTLVEAGSNAEKLSIIKAPELLLNLVLSVQKIKSLRTAPLAQMVLVMEIFKCVTVLAFKGPQNVPDDLKKHIGYVYPGLVLAHLKMLAPGGRSLAMNPLGNLQDSFKELTKTKGKRAAARSRKSKAAGDRNSRRSASRKREEEDPENDEDGSDEENENDNKPKPPKRSASARRRRFDQWKQDQEEGPQKGCCGRK